MCPEWPNKGFSRLPGWLTEDPQQARLCQTSDANAVISLWFSSRVFIYILFSPGLCSEAGHAVNYERIPIRHLSLMIDAFKQDSNVISKIKASLLGQVQQEVEVRQTLPIGLALGLVHIFLQLLLPCR